MKLYTFFGIALQTVLFIGLINGEVNFCLEFDSTSISKNEGSLEEVPTLLDQVGQEIKKIITESVFGKETMEYDNFHLNFSHPAVTVDADFNNGTAYTADQTIRLWTLKDGGLEIFNLTFPSITANGSYNGSGYVGAHGLFNIYGNGTFELSMTNFSVAALTGLKINSTALCIPVSVYVYLEYFQSNFANFMNGDADLEPLLNGAIQAIVPEAIQIILRESMDEGDPYLQAIIDKFLHGTTSQSLSRLLYILTNNKDQLESILKNV